MSSNSPTLLGTSGVAHLLKMSETHVRTLADRGDIPYERDNSNRRVFRMADILRIDRKRQRRANRKTKSDTQR